MNSEIKMPLNNAIYFLCCQKYITDRTLQGYRTLMRHEKYDMINQWLFICAEKYAGIVILAQRRENETNH